MTVVTSTIGAGRDYATVSAWEAATDTDLVSLTETHIGVLYDQVPGSFIFSGAVTNSTYYRQLKANERYDSVWGVGAKITGTGSYVVSITEDNFLLGPGVGVFNSATSGTGGCVEVNADSVVVDSVYAENTTSAGGTGFHTEATRVSTFRNCLAVGAKAASGLSVGFGGGTTGTALYHCLAYGIGGGALAGTGFVCARFIVKNCISMDCGTEDFDFSLVTINDYNLSSDATADGTNSLVNKTAADIWGKPDSREFRLRGPDGVDDGVAIASVTKDYNNNAHNSGSTGTEMGPFDGVGLGYVILVPGIVTAESVSGAATVIPTVFCDVDSIASAEAFGTLIISTGAITVSPDSIASAEAFGTLIISTGSFTVSPDSIASAEAFGTAQLNLTLYPTGIASAEAFGSVQVSFSIAPSGIASAEAFGTAQLNLTLYPTGIASAEAFGSLAISTGSFTVSPDSIASAEAFGTVQVAFNIYPAGIASAEAFGTAQLNLTIYPAGIASAEAFGSVLVSYDQIVSPTGIASAEAFGSIGASAIYGHESLRNSIRSHFDSNTSIGTVIYDNMTAEPPDSGIWVRFSVSTAFSEQTHCGHQIQIRTYGDATASIYCPIAEGDGAVMEVADDIRILFRDSVVSSVVFLQPSIERIGREQRWWRLDVVCPFYYDDTKEYPDDYSPSIGVSGTVESAHNVIRTQFKELVADVLGIQVQYDNVALEPPDNEAWVRLTILDGDSTRSSYGTYKTTGVVDISVFIPLGEGDQEAFSIADRIVNAFLPATVQGVQFRVPSASSIGRSGRFWQVSVTCPFQIIEASP